MEQSKNEQLLVDNENLASAVVKAEVQFQSIKEKYDHSEKDKVAMETYYDNKWATEFNHVRARLEKKYLDRIKQIEDETEAKLESMQVRVDFANHQLEQTVKRNKLLEVKYDEDRGEKLGLRNQVRELK